MTKLALCTVIYENYEVLNDFVSSLACQDSQNYHLFIADASSNAQPLNISIPHTYFTIENKGYAYGINRCLQAALQKEFDVFCVINDDTYLKKDFVTQVVKSLSETPQSIIGGKIYYAPEYEYYKERYTTSQKGKIIWYAGGTNDWANVLTYHAFVDQVDDGKLNIGNKVPTDFVTGCLMCFDKYVIDQIGMWDEQYFLYYEDADYCERAKRKNIPLFFDPNIVIWHKNAQSTDGSGSKVHLHYQNKNRLRFGLRYAPLRAKAHLLKNYFFGH